MAVYAEVARVPAYGERGLEYHDLCDPRWLPDEPELFWGVSASLCFCKGCGCGALMLGDF